MTRMTHPGSGSRLLALLALVMLLAAVSACQAARESRTYVFVMLNGSGVTGSVTLTDLGDATQVDIDVEAAGHAQMPAHIHPGSCGQLVPQPSYPLEDVRDGRSSTEIPALFTELVNASAAVNIHSSPEDMMLFTACAPIGPG